MLDAKRIEFHLLQETDADVLLELITGLDETESVIISLDPDNRFLADVRLRALTPVVLYDKGVVVKESSHSVRFNRSLLDMLNMVFGMLNRERIGTL